MRRLFLAALMLVVIAAVDGHSTQEFGRDVTNVAAFARLYGVARYFYPSDTAATIDWNRFAVLGVKRVREATNAESLAVELQKLFVPLGPGFEIGRTLSPIAVSQDAHSDVVAWYYLGAGLMRQSGSPFRRERTNRPALSIGLPPISSGTFWDKPPRPGAHVDLDLGRGLKGRVPIALTDKDARYTSTDLKSLLSSIASLAVLSAQPDLDVRLADTVVAWNGFRHFYPYWEDVGVDWDARLAPLLTVALKAVGRNQEAEALRLLIAEVHDGHGRLTDNLESGYPSFLPLRLALVEDRLVVSATGVSDEIPRGSIVTTIDGMPASERIAAEMRRVSGSLQWKKVKAPDAITIGPTGSVVKMELEKDGRSFLVHLRRESAWPWSDEGRGSLVELAPSIWYVNLPRVQWKELAPRLPTLASAAAVIFDVRGYPSEAGARLLPYLLQRSENDYWMHIPKIVEPFGQIKQWMSLGWALKPAAPHFTGKRVFLTDARAISYAESVMGYVADHKLGTIIGSATAGTNGNVALFLLPSGFAVSFTGMRVTARDGHTSRHLRGIQPDILITPTVAGLSAGRDEVLEHALRVVRRQKP